MRRRALQQLLPQAPKATEQTSNRGSLQEEVNK